MNFDDTIERIKTAIAVNGDTYNNVFKRICHQCGSREVISDRTVYCSKQTPLRAYRNNCRYTECPLIHGGKG